MYGRRSAPWFGRSNTLSEEERARHFARIDRQIIEGRKRRKIEQRKMVMDAIEYATHLNYRKSRILACEELDTWARQTSQLPVSLRYWANKVCLNARAFEGQALASMHFNVTEIGRLLGRSRRTIYRDLEKDLSKSPTFQRRKSKAEEIITLTEMGCDAGQIVAITHCNRRFVFEIRSRYWKGYIPDK